MLHNGMTDYELTLVKLLFQANQIQIIVSQTEFCFFLNDTFCYLAIIADMSSKDTPLHSMLQMVGRACRQDVDTHSKVFLLLHTAQKDHFLKFIQESIPVES